MEIDLKSKHVLFMILNYNFKHNLYDVVEYLLLYAFSFSSLSHKHYFKFFIQYKSF